MELLQQFQGVLGSLMLGGLFLFFYQIFQAILKHKYLLLLWKVFQVVYFFIYVIGYYCFMCEYTYGIYNFFFTLSLISGVVIYLAFYQKGVSIFLNPLSETIDKYIKTKEEKLKKLYQARKLKKKKAKEKKQKKFKRTNSSNL